MVCNMHSVRTCLLVFLAKVHNSKLEYANCSDEILHIRMCVYDNQTAKKHA